MLTLSLCIQSTGEHIEKTRNLLASQLAAFAAAVLDQPARGKGSLPEDSHSCPIDFMDSPRGLV